MVRQKMKCQGKFFLFNERIRQYFHAMGVEDSGDGPEAYLHWSPYFAGAMGFDTIKTARSMQHKLAKKGAYVLILNAKREAVM